MKRHFTLVEIVIALIILGILATIGIPLYNNAIEDAKAKACELNLKVLLGALEAYSLENDHLPATLGELRQDDMRRAWAKVLKQEGGWKVKLTYFLIDLDGHGLVYAQQWLNKYIGSGRFTSCPANTAGGISYGLNANLAGIPLSQYRAVIDTPIIADADAALFNVLVTRHKKYLLFPFTGVNEYAQAVINTPAGEKKVVKSSPGTEGKGGGPGSEEKEQKKEELKQKAQELKEKAQELRQKAQELKQKAQELREKAKGLEATAKEGIPQAQELREQAQNLERQAQELREEAQGLERQAQELRGEVQDLREEAKDLKEQEKKEKIHNIPNQSLEIPEKLKDSGGHTGE